MKSLYQILIELPKHSCRFSGKEGGYVSLLKFDLRNKTIRNRRTKIMKDGCLANKISLTDGTEYDLTDIPLINGDELAFVGINDLFSNPYDVIESLFGMYNTSIPTERTQFSRSNFQALQADELSFSQMTNNIDRVTAQYMLEGYILLMSVSKRITWENPGLFYWQSSRYKNLIIFKEWILWTL